MTSILKEFKIFNYLKNAIKIQIKCFYVTSDCNHAYCVANDDQVYGVGRGIHEILNYKEIHEENYTKIEELCDKNVVEFIEDHHQGMFARTINNRIYGWGRNNHHLFESYQDYSRPHQVEFFKLKFIVQISFGENYFLALSSKNKLYGQGLITRETPRIKKMYDSNDDQVSKCEISKINAQELASSKMDEQIKTVYCFKDIAFVITVEGLIYCSSSDGWRKVSRLTDVCKIQKTETLVIFLRKNALVVLWDEQDRKWIEFYVDSIVNDICAISSLRSQLIFEEKDQVSQFTGFFIDGPDPFDIRGTNYRSIFEYNLFEHQITQQTIFIDENAIKYLGGDQEYKVITVEDFKRNKQEVREELNNSNKTNPFSQIIAKVIREPSVAEVPKVIVKKDPQQSDKEMLAPKKLKNFRVFNPFPKNLKTGVKCFYQSGDYTSDDYIAFYVTNNNRVYGYGENRYGKLGLGHSNKVFEFIEVPGLNNKNIEEFFDCGHCMLARTNGNKLYAWGLNSYGKLLREERSKKAEFVEPIPFDLGDKKIKIVHIEHCISHRLALSTNGRVYGWGHNDFCQILCDLDQEQVTKPVLIEIKHGGVEKKIKFIHCSHNNSFAVTFEGQVFVWGAANCGWVTSPELLQVKNIEKVFAQNHAWLFLKTDGSILIIDNKNEWPLNEPCLINCEIKFSNICVYPSLSTKNQEWSPTVLQSDEFVWLLNQQGDFIQTNYHNFYDYFLYVNKTTLGTIYITEEGHLKTKNIFCDKNLLKIEFKYIYQDKYKKYFTEEKDLGQGGYGKVFLVSSKNKPDKKFAVKQIDLRDAQRSLNVDIHFIYDEITMMTKVKSEFVVHYFDSWIETKLIDKGVKGGEQLKEFVYIQMELLSQSLKDVIKTFSLMRSSSNNNSFEKYFHMISCVLFKELIEALDYLHTETAAKKQIIHRDLKPENVLISDGSNGRFLKLCDFGLAKFHDNIVFVEDSVELPSTTAHQCFDKHTQRRGDHRYMAPEVNKCDIYNTKADIYSLALIAGEVFNLVEDPKKLRRRQDLMKYYDSSKHQEFKTEFEVLVKTLKDCLYSEKFDVRPDCKELLKRSGQWTIDPAQMQNTQDDFSRFISKAEYKIFKLIYEKSKKNIQSIDQ